MKKNLTVAQKKADIDLWIIIISTFAMLAIYLIFQQNIIAVFKDTTKPILLRTLFAAFFQFGVAGLGITIVSFYRKEPFTKHGLNSRHLLKSIGLSLLCCAPYAAFVLLNNSFNGYMPFQGVMTTKEVLQSGFPTNIIGMAITAVIWGFFEGFNYIFISDKINERYPTKYKYFNWGAFACSCMCILVHGIIGIRPEDIFEMVAVICIIYGMIMVREKTGNAWGTVAVFVLFWNAF
ncbi:MAG TPA: hypothetical protein GXX17_08115 [Clostridiales bacterium]|nr:hypothetical protein [Clostridiales bacterium]